jgi:pyruvate carboxylase
VLAVDPSDFMPATGHIEHLALPGGPGVRIDSGVFEGSEVLPYYNPLLVKVTAWGETRGVAILRERRALGELQLMGVQTNLGLLLQLLDRTSFIRGAFDTNFIEERPYLPEAKSNRGRMAAALLVALLRHRGDERAKTHPAEAHSSAWKRQARREMLGGGR